MKIVSLKTQTGRTLRNAEVVGTLDPLDVVVVNDSVVITLHDSRTLEGQKRRTVLSGTKAEVKTFLETCLAELA